MVRWTLPVGFALVVGTIVVGVRVAADGAGYAQPARQAHRPQRPPRFVAYLGDVEVGPLTASAGHPWLQVVRTEKPYRVVDAIDSPPSGAGAAQEVIAGPGGTLLVVTSRAEPCESRIYRVRLTAAGHVAGTAPVKGGVTPALAAGLTMSPDGRRIAYATAPCAPRQRTRPRSTPDTTPMPQPVTSSPSLTVVDTTTGLHRTWTTDRASLIGEIVWAADSRTVGYSLGRLSPTVPPPSPLAGYHTEGVGGITLRALDTRAPGTDLLAGRVLFRPPGDAGEVDSVVMNPDGRSGYGVIRKGQPPSTIVFSFTQGHPMHVTHITPPARNGQVMVGVASPGDPPRYACLGGLDAFGRAVTGAFMADIQGHRGCAAATVP
jgi:hypothetical protein